MKTWTADELHALALADYTERTADIYTALMDFADRMAAEELRNGARKENGNE